jgi:hypothetical protein
MARFGALALVALTLCASVAEGAELPSQVKSKTPPEHAQPVKKCNIAGIAGVVAADGVCVRLSGSISAEVSAGHLR